MAGTKTWVVTSANPRPSHAAIDGETVALDQPFSIGLMYPGDSSGDVAEVANCTCVVETQLEANSVVTDARSTVSDLGKTFDASNVSGVVRNPLEIQSRFAEYDQTTRLIELNSNANWADYWEIRGFRVGEGSGVSAVETATTHEFGHSLEQSLNSAEWRALADRVNDTAGRNLLARDHPGELFIHSSEAGIADLEPDAIDAFNQFVRDNLSRYSETSGHEFVAEAFAESQVERSPRAIARTVRDFFEDARPAGQGKSRALASEDLLRVAEFLG